jgi:signal transduction histidine kinase
MRHVVIPPRRPAVMIRISTPSARLLEEVSREVSDAARDLRDPAHGIYPPLLADSGLPTALAAAARRSAMPTTVDAATLGRYPAEVEAAVYFCCLEAIQNACKHAGEGATIALRLREDAGMLTFDVADDGKGFDAQGRGLGAGFVNMADRLGALGGSLRVESAPQRGTMVPGAVPAGAGTGPDRSLPAVRGHGQV